MLSWRQEQRGGALKTAHSGGVGDGILPEEVVASTAGREWRSHWELYMSGMLEERLSATHH